MKFILTMYVCSAIAQQCGSGIIKGTEYKDFNDCLKNGYSESQLFLSKISPEEINKHQILIKFSCTEQIGKGV